MLVASVMLQRSMPHRRNLARSSRQRDSSSGNHAVEFVFCVKKTERVVSGARISSGNLSGSTGRAEKEDGKNKEEEEKHSRWPVLEHVILLQRQLRDIFCKERRLLFVVL